MKNGVQTGKYLCAIYGDGAIADGTVHVWFARFSVGNFDLEEQKR